MTDRTFKSTGTLEIKQEVDLESCHSDPIHQCAHIQPHGTFLEVDVPSMRIRSAAQNSESIIERPVSDVIGEKLGKLFPDHALSALQSSLENRLREQKYFSIDTRNLSLRISVFPVGNRAGFDIEKRTADEGDAEILMTNLSDRIDYLRNVSDRNLLFDRTLQSIRSFTQYDRLMVYRFDEEGHGSVVSEIKRNHLESFEGLQFPASDIPEPVRRIYRKNTVRLIPDVDVNPVPVLGPDGIRDREELDLTYSELRAVPPVHRKYMRNMGVRGSLSLSLMVDDELWGLISCHAETPKHLNRSQKSACKLIAKTLSNQIGRLISRQREQQYNRIRKFWEGMDEPITDHNHLFQQLEEQSTPLRSLMDADVFYLDLNGEIFWRYEDERQKNAARELLSDIRDHLKRHETCSVKSIMNEWDSDWPHSSDISGFYARRLTSSANCFTVWFRPEHRETIKWGGDPRNPLTVDKHGELSPRNSFDEWTQIVSDKCQNWSHLDEFTAEEFSRLLRELEIELQNSLLERTNREIEAKNEELRETEKRLKRSNREKEKLLARVREMARTDELTGLFNRDALMNQLSAELKRVKRYDQELSIVFIDLDHFKEVNDRYGHQAGDDVLEVTGRLLREQTRDSDIAGRYGGEEFMAVLPSTGTEEAARFAERFADSLRDQVFESNDETFQLTCSAGVSSLQSEDEDSDTIIQRADAALYRAKNSGRDTVCRADEV